VGLSQVIQRLDKLDALIEPMLRAARIPGAGVAIVAGGETVFARGYGYRDLDAKLPATSATIYPIASTTKAINATLIGMLVDDGLLAWDTPVQRYLPSFQLRDACISAQVTLRDLIAMRTGLPRHDWLWTGNPMTRTHLVQRLRHLELSAAFRERFQYNNLTVTTAGHIAEVVTGQTWEELVQKRLLDPLSMHNTGFTMPAGADVSLSYHENSRRDLLLSRRLASDVTAPSGGSIHSTVEDMARWMLFNLNHGKVADRSLINSQTITEIHSPQVTARTDPSTPTPNAAYAMGWFVDTYNGRARVAHGGYVHDVNSEVMLFPQDDIGIVSFTNFGFPTLARLMGQHAFDLLMGSDPTQSLTERLAQYESRVEETRKRMAAVHRVGNTTPSHSLDEYAGVYVHPGYGEMHVIRNGTELTLKRNDLELSLEHWHYDAWVARDCEMFFIHVPHAFDRSNRMVFDTDVDGGIAGLSIRLEPSVAPIRFEKR
jgi:CubicO group peptidase (beta-lactamase class C family)